MAAIAKPGIKVALQNCSMTGMGAFTGEHSCEQIKDAGIEWVVIGHSERRSLYGETDEVCAKKLARALECGLKVIYCIGEKLPERESGKTNDVCAEHGCGLRLGSEARAVGEHRHRLRAGLG